MGLPKGGLKLSLQNRRHATYVISVIGLFLALCTTLMIGMSNGKDWFRLDDAARSPTFGLWTVCYNGDWSQCVDPGSRTEFDYMAALFSARIFVLAGGAIAVMLVILACASVCDSPKVNRMSPMAFVVLALLIVVLLTLGNSIFEGGVRRRVKRTLSPYGLAYFSTQFGWAGGCAWTGYILAIATLAVYVVYFALYRRKVYAEQDDEEEDDFKKGDNSGYFAAKQLDEATFTKS